MAIVFQSKKYNIAIDSKMIIGVMGKNYQKFISSLVGENIYHLEKRVSISNKKVYSLLDIDKKNVQELIKEYNFGEEVLNKKIYELSHSEQTLLKYILMVLEDKSINIIDEPYQDLDYENKKKITLLLNKMIKNNKTVIIGSMDSNIIYSLCKKILFINERSFYYGDIDSLSNKKLLKKYDVEMPDLIKFVDLAKTKKIKLKYSNDIRDLIKDVYRNVSQK